MNTNQKLFDIENKRSKFIGIIDQYAKFAEQMQLLSEEHWNRFEDQFRKDSDSFDDGWRGEYWGKMMRGAALTYSYTRNPKLYEMMKRTIKNMIALQDESGRISSFGVDKEFKAWDMWCRKYVMLGMQYFLEINTDKEFEKEIIECIKKQADYIISKVGKEPGKIEIYYATNHMWKGLNACSILEPFVRLYNLTKEQKYLDFATYIVESGFTFGQNIIDLCIEGKVQPWQFKSTKAYEMTSCFEGLLEYYYATGIEKYKTAVINFANNVLNSDFTVIGSAGCTHELFDHSTARQASMLEGVMQETCVTVTLMKFIYRVALLTGESRLFDAFETSMYNAYLGSVNINKNINEAPVRKFTSYAPDAILEALPYDSYSPLAPGKRGQAVGGLKVMSDNRYYGCCACIASAGWGLIDKVTLLRNENGFTMNLFIPGIIETEYNGVRVRFYTSTDYPVDGKISIKLDLSSELEFVLNIRNPKWNKKSSLYVNNRPVEITDNYTSIKRIWKSGDLIEFNLDMTTNAITPIYYGEQMLYTDIDWAEGNHKQVKDIQDEFAMNRVSLRRGPLALAIDDRMVKDVTKIFRIKLAKTNRVNAVISKNPIAPFKTMVELEIPMENGNKLHVTDYASAGQDWSSNMATWFLIK